MGLFMTLEGLTEEDAVRLASEEAVPADRLRVFDLHCDTLDRLAFHGDASVPGGFAAHDARIPAHRMATLADNDAHVSLARTADAGVRMVTLTWNGPNALGSGNDTSHGLTGFGRSCVGELERRGIIVDVSHLNDAGFKDVCATARRPFAASHSNARAVCGHPRNLADWQLRELADCGGIAGLNFCTQFLTDRLADPTRDDVLRHVDHVLETAGEDVLALGSDYDGCDVPSWLEPCDRIGALHELLACEFGRDIADKVFFRNARDFFERVESV